MEYNATGDYQMCQQYPNGQYKPVGLIQKNAARMRFGAAGYLMDSSQARAGGVIRAKMKSVGPTYAQNSGAGSDNPYKEWDANTGVYVAHPDAGMLTSAETDGGKVKQSGVINYLNKFGKANGYKSNDPFSELYYASLRSLRNMAPPADYVSGLNSAMFDGFPVIQSIADESDVNQRPIQYWCQRSYVFLMTDGQPTDSWESAADRIKQKRAANIIACAAGDGADATLLKRITETVVELNTVQPDALKAFFKWVSSSIKTTSASIAQTPGEGPVSLPPPPPQIQIVP